MLTESRGEFSDFHSIFRLCAFRYSKGTGNTFLTRTPEPEVVQGTTAGRFSIRDLKRCVLVRIHSDRADSIINMPGTNETKTIQEIVRADNDRVTGLRDSHPRVIAA